MTEGEAAERWYAEAVERLARTPFRTELARAHLLYGEWLRREGRRVDAREQLAPAYDMFAAMGAEAFAERARRELLATGEKVRKRNLSRRANELTPQEEHVARLARDGRTNAEIGAELFLSVRTVEWHLRKVYMKLGIASRKDLKQARRPGAGTCPARANHSDEVRECCLASRTRTPPISPTSRIASVNASGASWGTLCPMPPSIVRCAYGPENLLAYAPGSGWGAPFASPSRVIVGTVIAGPSASRVSSSRYSGSLSASPSRQR